MPAQPTPQAKKSKSTKQDTPVVEEPVVVAPPTSSEPVVVAPSPEVVVVDKKKKSTKTSAPVVVETPVQPSTTDVPVVPPSTEESEDKTNINVLQHLVQQINTLAQQFKEVQNALKPVIKEHEKQVKIIERIQKKRENARKSPSGFAKPNKISDELCNFIGVPIGTEKSRTDITRYINAYVKEHNLNKPSNRRVIIPDEKLKAILNIKDNEEVTFFILQRLISHHFPTSQSKVVVPVV